MPRKATSGALEVGFHDMCTEFFENYIDGGY